MFPIPASRLGNVLFGIGPCAFMSAGRFVLYKPKVIGLGLMAYLFRPWPSLMYSIGTLRLGCTCSEAKVVAAHQLPGAVQMSARGNGDEVDWDE